MEFFFELIGYGLISPAVSSAIVVVLLRLLLPAPMRRDLIVVALVAGFFVSWLLFPWAPMRPQSHWHWLPYLGLLAGVVGCLGQFSGLWLRCTIYLVLSVVTAWLLVPMWQDLQPVRHWYLIGLVTVVWVFLLAAEPGLRNGPPPLLAAILVGISIAAAAVLAQSGTMKFAQLAGVLVPVLATCGLATWNWPDEFHFASIVVPFQVLLIGFLFIGYVNSFSDVPGYCYGLVGAAPLGPTACQIPLIEKRLGGWKSLGMVGSAALLAGTDMAASFLAVGVYF